MSIERNYHLFISSLDEKYDLKDIDFFGINIDLHGNIRFKVYYTQEKSHIQDNNFYEFLKSRNLIRYFESVTDSKNPKKYRNDFGLQNRTDKNILDLFNFIESNAQVSHSQIELAKKIAKLKTTDKKGFNYSSLYFVSAEMSNALITKSKFYYYTRFCKEPDVLSHNSFYKDNEYLQFIQNLKVDKFAKIAEYAKQMLEIPETHLWLIGYDAGTNENKYKIYINTYEEFDIYKLLYLDSFIPGHLKQVGQWIQEHDEYWMYGFALCIDDNDKSNKF